jgi:chromosome segregation ATPase
MTRQGTTNGGYFVCGQYHLGGLCQRNGKFRGPQLEAFVVDQLHRLRQDPQFLDQIRRQGHRQRRRDLEQELASHRQEWEKIPQRLQRWKMAYEREAVSVEEFAERKRALEGESQHLQQVIRHLEQQVLQDQQRQQARDAAQEALRTFEERFEHLPLPTQKQLLRHLIEKIVIREKDARLHFRLS